MGDNFDWIVGSGGTQSSFTGPSADHNGNRTGNYGLNLHWTRPTIKGGGQDGMSQGSTLPF